MSKSELFLRPPVSETPQAVPEDPHAIYDDGSVLGEITGVQLVASEVSASRVLFTDDMLGEEFHIEGSQVRSEALAIQDAGLQGYFRRRKAQIVTVIKTPDLKTWVGIGVGVAVVAAGITTGAIVYERYKSKKELKIEKEASKTDSSQ